MQGSVCLGCVRMGGVRPHASRCHMPTILLHLYLLHLPLSARFATEREVVSRLSFDLQRAIEQGRQALLWGLLRSGLCSCIAPHSMS